jgi:Copper transport outer membrane protein, MctB
MLNFRYHVVSLVAVFLALLIGILIGIGALDRTTVDFLQNRLDAVEANANARSQENDSLKTQVDHLGQSATATAPFAVTNRLTQVPTLLVAVRGVDSARVTGTVELARRAGAIAPGVLWLEEKWALDDESDVAALAKATGVALGTKAEVRAAAFDAFVGRLLIGPVPDNDVLRGLVDGGFVAYEGVGDAGNRSLAQLGGPGTHAVFVLGADGTLTARQSLLPFARSAVKTGLPLVGAEVYRAEENGPGRGSFVGVVRSDGELAAAVSTVDDFDEPSGPAVALLALSDLGRNVVGHFGFGDDATAVAPDWWQP